MTTKNEPTPQPKSWGYHLVTFLLIPTPALGSAALTYYLESFILIRETFFGESHLVVLNTFGIVKMLLFTTLPILAACRFTYHLRDRFKLRLALALALFSGIVAFNIFALVMLGYCMH